MCSFCTFRYLEEDEQISQMKATQGRCHFVSVRCVAVVKNSYITGCIAPSCWQNQLQIFSFLTHMQYCLLWQLLSHSCHVWKTWQTFMNLWDCCVQFFYMPNPFLPPNQQCQSTERVIEFPLCKDVKYGYVLKLPQFYTNVWLLGDIVAAVVLWHNG